MRRARVRKEGTEGVVRGVAGTHSIKLNLDFSSALSAAFKHYQSHKVLKPAPNMVTHQPHSWLQWKRPSQPLFHWSRTGMGLTWYSCTLHPSLAPLLCCHEPPPPACRGGNLSTPPSLSFLLLCQPSPPSLLPSSLPLFLSPSLV